MNLTEWHEVLATEPATREQIGAIHGEFRRLGYRDPWHRADRLPVTARLAECEPIGSSKDLSQGEAGRALRMLQQCENSGSLHWAAHGPRGYWGQFAWALVAALRTTGRIANTAGRIGDT